MELLLLIVAGIVVGCCITSGGTRTIFLSVVVALLYLPIGVIVALSKSFR